MTKTLTEIPSYRQKNQAHSEKTRNLLQKKLQNFIGGRNFSWKGIELPNITTEAAFLLGKS
jgi:hypothetical protein